MYENLFAARKVFSGFIEAEGRESTLLMLNNLAVQVVAAEADADIADYVERVGEGFSAMTLRVRDLDGAEGHLVDNGIGAARVSRSYLTAKRGGFFDVRYDFTDEPLPGGEGAAREAAAIEAYSGHPAGLSNDASVTLFVPEADGAFELYSRVLGARVVEHRTGRIASGRNIRVSLGSGGVSLMEPRTDRDIISRMKERQGVSGFHGVFFRVRDLAKPRRYFGSKGVGVVGGEDLWAMPHPRMCFGARFILIKSTEEYALPS